jgi:hypothetical protein
MQPESNIRTTALDDGGLVLLSERSGTLYRCNATAADMWAALGRHAGEVDAAARSIANLYHADPTRVRADLDRLIERWQQAGLVRAEP